MDRLILFLGKVAVILIGGIGVILIIKMEAVVKNKLKIKDM